MKWFSINGILTEMKRIRWPKGKDLAKDSATVIAFTACLLYTSRSLAALRSMMVGTITITSLQSVCI